MRDRRYPKSRLCVFIISVLTLIILICLLFDRIFHRQPTLLPDLPPDSIVLMFIGSMIALFIAGYSSPYNARVLNEMEKKEEMDCLADAEGLLHISGLSVPNQTDCHVYLNRGGLIVDVLLRDSTFPLPISLIYRLWISARCGSIMLTTPLEPSQGALCSALSERFSWAGLRR